MNFVHFSILVVVLSTLFFCVSGHASIVSNGFSEKNIDEKGETNSVRVRCFMNDKQFKLSVAGVLQSRLTERKSNKLDIALTTGHGLVDEDGQLIGDCYVYGPNGRKVEVKAVRMAPNYREASSTDWAVLVFDRIKSKQRSFRRPVAFWKTFKTAICTLVKMQIFWIKDSME